MDSFRVLTVETNPYGDQKPGTSGLRKKVRVFRQPHYLENFIQSIFDSVPQLRGATLVLGGDGRYYNGEALQIILRMAAANGIAGILVGRDGILSTPAASCLVRKHRARGAIVLTASHNPGGPEADFGIKYNIANGGSAPEPVTDAIFRCSRQISRYRILDSDEIDLSRLGGQRLADMRISVVDPVADYAMLMERLFDFERISDLFHGGGFRLCFDAMHGVTGEYARNILEQRLGAPAGTVRRAGRLPDFGGAAPDPNPLLLGRRYADLSGADSFDLVAACDGDGDRHLLMSAGQFVNSCDSIAIMAANACHIPGYRARLNGLARTMPASPALDRVAAAFDISCFETPTGWKFFGNLLDAGDVTLCGDESFGAGSDHLREKDGLWAILFWLNMMAARGESFATLVQSHWRRFGRDYYLRQDYEALPEDCAQTLIHHLRRHLDELPGRCFAGYEVSWSDEFSYTDPHDGSCSRAQGIRIGFHNGARIVYRLSGTGTRGATLRMYLGRFEADPARQQNTPEVALRELAAIAGTIADIARYTGRDQPDLIV